MFPRRNPRHPRVRLRLPARDGRTQRSVYDVALLVAHVSVGWIRTENERVLKLKISSSLHSMPGNCRALRSDDD